jgi:type IV pilus biogenesis protein CpaD/CtpE
MMRGHGTAPYKENTVKRLVALALITLLAGCATQGKSESQIFDEAATAHVMSLPAGANKVRLHSVKIASHGVIGDMLATVLGGGANAGQLRQELLNAQRLGDSGFLIIGARSSIDVAVVENACEGLGLQGMNIYYAGTEAQQDKVRHAVEQARAQFHFINTQ